jgi:putative membrane protein
MMGYGTGLGFGLGGMLWMLGGILLIVGLVVLVVWAVSRATSANHVTGASPVSTDPLDILRARFARGEITEAEYTQAANILKAGR